MKLKNIFLVFLILLSTLSIFPRVLVLAQDDANSTQDNIDELEGKINKYEKKLSELQSKEDTLSGEIEYMTSQINLTELRIQNSTAKISQKNKDIDKLSNDITDLSGRILKIQENIDLQQKALNARLRERYKSGENSPIIIVFGSDTINQIVKKSEYLRISELQDKKLLAEMDKTKKAYSYQRGLYEDKKVDEIKLKNDLVREKANLDVYKGQLVDQQQEKQELLNITNNDEAKYQKLLEDARSQLASFQGFTSSAGGGVIGSNGFGKGKKGWYYSQRDSRWANVRIGSSSEVVLDVGCLVTSVAMVYKSQGKDVTPETIAKRKNYFLTNTAYMIVPDDFSSSWGSYSGLASQIDANLKKGIPVIVGLKAGPYGTHFVVLSSKDGSDYIMYDPWYGPDLKLTSHYGTSAIFEAIFY